MSLSHTLIILLSCFIIPSPFLSLSLFVSVSLSHSQFYSHVAMCETWPNATWFLMVTMRLGRKGDQKSNIDPGRARPGVHMPSLAVFLSTHRLTVGQPLWERSALPRALVSLTPDPAAGPLRRRDRRKRQHRRTSPQLRVRSTQDVQQALSYCSNY